MIHNSVLDFFRNYFFALDYILAAIVLTLIVLLYSAKRISQFTWILYWIGVGVGLLWELPIGLLRVVGFPVAQFIESRPILPFPFHSIVHSITDGGIFLVGVCIVRLGFNPPYFNDFKGKEFLIFIIWGQLQSLAVEVLSLIGGGWEYIPYWWNPTLFEINGHPFTLLPQLIWFIAPIIYYALIINLKWIQQYKTEN
ncbi:MAG: hypothetical protein GF353_03460 [Candidatus Lokiarchaeota archaeon]|nr:hypothetical protein [Candidatus Lokiarchaeota archaeon]